MPILTNQGSRFLGGSRVPADPVPMAGAELLTNGGMEADANWTGWITPSTNERSSTQARTGTYSRHLATAGVGGIQQGFAGDNKWLLASVWAWVISGNGRVLIADSESNKTAPGLAVSAAWTQILFCIRAASTTTIRPHLPAAGEVFFDDASVVPLTLSSLLSTAAYASADCDLSAAVTRTAGTQAGLVARLDDATTPANFVIAYLDGGGNVKVDKIVAGVYTNVISGAITYVAGQRLRLVCSGNNVSAYYNGVQVGSTVTVADAGIVSNVRHGKFSTYAANTLASYVAA